MVNTTFRPFYPWERDPLAIVQKVVWASGPVWMGREYLESTGFRTPNRLARGEFKYMKKCYRNYRMRLYSCLQSSLRLMA